jgi:hypothetical protein
MLSLKNRIENMNLKIQELRKLKLNSKELQRNNSFGWQDANNIDLAKSYLRYYNIAHTLIKRRGSLNILEMNSKEILDMIVELGIETKWKNNNKCLDISYIKNFIKEIQN